MTVENRTARFQSCLRPLTQQDRIRLESLKNRELYRDTVLYMLEKNRKLEQEIVSFYGTELIPLP